MGCLGKCMSISNFFQIIAIFIMTFLRNPIQSYFILLEYKNTFLLIVYLSRFINWLGNYKDFNIVYIFNNLPLRNMMHFMFKTGKSRKINRKTIKVM